MNYNKSGLFVLLTTVMGSFIWFIWVVYGVSSINLGEVDHPSNNETVNNGKPLPSDESLKKLWLSHPNSIAQGNKVYQTYCATCHGPTGLGDGPAGQALTPPPRNLVEGQWKQGGSSIQLYKTLTQGIEGTAMVPFAYLSKADRWALVHYIRSITNNEVKDDLQKLEDFAKTNP